MTIKTLWEQIQRSSTTPPTRLKIPNTRSDLQTTTTQPFQPNQQYFQIRINELYLSTSRKWFSEYDPLVFAATEFIYDKSALSNDSFDQLATTQTNLLINIFMQ